VEEFEVATGGRVWVAAGDHAEQFLKPNITFSQLDTQAYAVSDNQTARRMNSARATMFKTIYNRSKSAA
jgi:hypothetical protein